MDSFKVVAAGGGIFLLVTVLVAIIGPRIETWPPAITGLGIGAFMVGLCVLATVLLGGGKPSKGTGPTLEDARSAGLVQERVFEAVRCFQVEEFEDEGSHYFVELANGETLYLNGQYLYEYEATDDDPELNQARRFPCSSFVVVRHKTEGYVFEIVCAGKVLAPEVVAPAMRLGDEDPPEDGQVFPAGTYDGLKAERLRVDRR